jgi:hypothetical protein
MLHQVQFIPFMLRDSSAITLSAVPLGHTSMRQTAGPSYCQSMPGLRPRVQSQTFEPTAAEIEPGKSDGSPS